MWNHMRTQWVCSREQRIALYKWSSISQSISWKCSKCWPRNVRTARPKHTKSSKESLLYISVFFQNAGNQLFSYIYIPQTQVWLTIVLSSLFKIDWLIRQVLPLCLAFYSLRCLGFVKSMAVRSFISFTAFVIYVKKKSFCAKCSAACSILVC